MNKSTHSPLTAPPDVPEPLLAIACAMLVNPQLYLDLARDVHGEYTVKTKDWPALLAQQAREVYINLARVMPP